jgi:hypothetical protein
MRAEWAVLHAIATRYDQHLPYTYSGIVLVALNPFSPLAIYGNEMIKSYAGKKKGDLEPHLFAIAEEALDCMRRGSGGGGKDPTGAGDQTIVVSGERWVQCYIGPCRTATDNTVVPARRSLLNTFSATLPPSKTPIAPKPTKHGDGRQKAKTTG